MSSDILIILILPEVSKKWLTLAQIKCKKSRNMYFKELIYKISIGLPPNKR